MASVGLLNRLKFWKRSIVDQNPHKDDYLNFPEYRLAYKLKRYEKYISQIENIIMWDNPVTSVLCIVFVNLLFWILVSLEWRFFGIVSTVLLAVTIHEAWTGHVWPEISVQVPASSGPNPEPASPRAEAISRHLTSFYSNVKWCAVWICNLRTQKPGLFCCGGVLGSGCLLLLARSVSGLTLVYSLIMAALLGPGLIAYCIPPSLKLTVAQHFTCVNRAFVNYALNDASDDEYLPNTTSEDLALLTRASDLNHDTYDSLTNPGSSSDMVSGLAMMPSHEEDSLATISDLEHGLSLPLDHAEDSDSNPDEHQMQFQSGHFNGDSSSDEEPFGKDLVFSEGADERDSAVARGFSTLIAQAVTRNLASSVGLLAGVLRPNQTAGERRSRRETDSDLEDFEVINRDELGS